MKLPYRPTLFKRFYKPPRYIIIHDVSCRFKGFSNFILQTKEFKTQKLRSNNFVFYDEYELGFHYVIERLNEDFETILGRPLNYMCLYDDIRSPYDVSIHICLLADYSMEIAENRLYQHLAFKAVVPCMQTYNIPIGNVVLYKDVSTGIENECPGMNFNKDKMLAAIRIYDRR